MPLGSGSETNEQYQRKILKRHNDIYDDNLNEKN